MVRKKHNNHGFSLVEMLAAVAILAILVTIAVTSVLGSSTKFKKKEYDDNAEAIAIAAQNRLTALVNSGDVSVLAKLGTADSSGSRYITNADENFDYILPPLSVDTDLLKGGIVIGFTPNGKVFEVFYFPDGLPDGLSTPPAAAYKTSDNVGYYVTDKEDDVTVEIAAAQLPTPQLTINNFDKLSLDIYLPRVRQLPEGKKLGFRVMLLDKDEKAIADLKAQGKTDDEINELLTIYSTDTYNLYNIESGNTYSFILDTPEDVRDSSNNAMIRNIDTTTLGSMSSVNSSTNNVPTGRFSTWARLTYAYYGDKEPISVASRTASSTINRNGFKLGDDVEIIVDVFALKPKNGSADYEQDKTYVSRNARVVFNSWFDKVRTVNYKGTDRIVADISCGRHLQHIGDLTEIRKNLKYLLPYDEATQTYKYSKGDAYSFVRSDSDHYEKYTYKDNVNSSINTANQLLPINFDNEDWKDENGKEILFDPINTASGFYFFGNYFPIKNLNVHTKFYAGLFGYSFKNHIYDIRLVNPKVESDMPLEVSRDYEMGVGGLIGTDRDSSEINNCQVYLEEVDGKYDDTRRISGKGYIGGLIGFCEDESIRQCSASAFVGTNNDPYVGGLIGGVTGDSSIKRCYAAGILRGQRVGGLVGAYIPDTDYSGDDLTIESCYTAGNIEYAKDSAGGLIGWPESEQRGYEKSAVRAHKNYCAVIYGVRQNSGAWSGTAETYNWTGEGEIYGTFNGDNAIWTYADGDIVADESAATQYIRVLALASYESENYNYYIPQKGIKYAKSGFFSAVVKDGKTLETLLQEFVNKYQNASTVPVEEVKRLRDIVSKQKSLQVLEEVRLELLSLKADTVDVDNPLESGKIKLDYNSTKMTVDSHTPAKGDGRRQKLLTEVVKDVIGDETNPKAGTALYYVQQLKALVDGSKTSVTVDGKTYSYNGTGENPFLNDFSALLTKYAAKFFTDTNDHNVKVDGTSVTVNFWPFVNEKGVLDQAYRDVRRFFEGEDLLTKDDVFHSDGEFREDKFLIDDSGDLYVNKDGKGQKGDLMVNGFFSPDEVTAMLNHDEPNPDEAYFKYVNGSGEEAVQYRIFDATTYWLDSDGNLYERNSDKKGNEKEKNFYLLKVDGNNNLIDDDGNVVFQKQGQEDYYVMEGFRDRVNENIIEMLFSLYNTGVYSWPGESIAANLSNDVWENEVNGDDGSARYLAEQASKKSYNDDYKDKPDGKTFAGYLDELFGKDYMNDFGGVHSGEHFTSERDAGLYGGLFDELKTLLLAKTYDADAIRAKYEEIDKKLDDIVNVCRTLRNSYSSGTDEYRHMNNLKDYATNLKADLLTCFLQWKVIGENGGSANWRAVEYAEGIKDGLWTDYARNLVKYADKGEYYDDYKDIPDNKIDSNRLKNLYNGVTQYVTGERIKKLINEIFGGEFEQGRKDRSEGINDGMFKVIIDELQENVPNEIVLRNQFDAITTKLNELYICFDVLGNAYYNGTDGFTKSESKANHMYSLRNYTGELEAAVEEYSRMSFTGGVEGAFDTLIDALTIDTYDADEQYKKVNVKDEIVCCCEIIENCLLNDSGIVLYNDSDGTPLAKIKELTMGTSSTTDTDILFDSDDWYNYSKYDFNANLYTTVFPYLEKSESYTGVFPFPMIIALRPTSLTEVKQERVTPMLLHYGDWLTPELWANNPNDPKLTQQKEAVSNLYATLTSSSSGSLKSDFDKIKEDCGGSIDNNDLSTGVQIEDVNAFETKMDSLITQVEAVNSSYGADSSASYGEVQAVYTQLQDLYTSMKTLHGKCKDSKKEACKKLTTLLNTYMNKLDGQMRTMRELWGFKE